MAWLRREAPQVDGTMINAAGVKTNREVVDLALKEFVAVRRHRNIGELFGRVEIDPAYDYEALRRED